MTKRPPLRLSTRLTIQYALIFSAVLLLLNAGTLLGVRYYLTRQAENPALYGASGQTMPTSGSRIIDSA